MATAGNIRNGQGSECPQLMTDMAGVYQYGVLIRLDWGVTVFRRKISASWSRSGTTVTVTETGHGKSVSDSVIVWDSTSPAAFPNATYTVATVPTADTYTVTGVAAGGTSGTCSTYQTYDLSADATATAGLNLPVNSIDDHWALTIGVDEQERVHIVGNIHNTGQNYIRSAANNITSWTSIASSSLPWASSGVDRCTYNIMDRMSDGTLLWFFSQNDANVAGRGRDWLAAYLPTGAGTTWSKMFTTGSGEFAQTSQTAVFGVEADRAYICGMYVDPADRIHVVGIWRTETGDADSQQQPYYLYSDSVGSADTWKRADGTAQAMPITWANRTLATITSAPGISRTYAPGVGIDGDGYPHVIFGNGASDGTGKLTNPDGSAMSNMVRCYWDGTAWQVANLTAIGSSQAPSIHGVRGDLFMITTASQRVRIRGGAGGATDAPSFLTGGPVGAPTSVGTFEPNPDPIRLKSGWIDLLIPDGDTPRVWSFGSHFRTLAA